MRFINKLAEEDVKKLWVMMQTSDTIRIRQRAHALLLSNKKYSIDAIADIFEVHRDTISRWFVHWEEHGIEGLADAPKPGRPRKKDGHVKKERDYKLLSDLKLEE